MKAKRLFSLVAVMALVMGQLQAGDKLSLRDIMRGEFRSESMTEVYPMADGETYAQISEDGKRTIQGVCH